jgi:ABC-2 type transport system permease protein
MHIIDLALKDLQQIFRDRKALLFLVVMPIIFTLFMGSLFAPSAQTDPRLPIGFIDRDPDGALGKSLKGFLDLSEAVRVAQVEETDSARLGEIVRNGKLAAVVIVPEGFSRETLAGNPVKLTLIVDPATSAGQTAGNAISSATNRVLGMAQSARLSADEFAAQIGFASETDRAAYLDEALSMAAEAWREPSVQVALEKTGASLDNQTQSAGSGFNQMSPGMIVQFVILGLVTSSTVLVIERKTKTLQRMLTTPISRAQIIAGHMLAMFVTVFLQEALLVGFGQIALGVDYLREPLAIVLVMVTLALWISGMGLLIGAIAKGEEQAIMWSLIAMFLFTALGGAWFPLDVTGQAFATIGHLTPGAWAMDGFQNVIVRGLGLNSVLAPVLVLVGYAALFFGLAVWRFRFE